MLTKNWNDRLVWIELWWVTSPYKSCLYSWLWYFQVKQSTKHQLPDIRIVSHTKVYALPTHVSNVPLPISGGSPAKWLYQPLSQTFPRADRVIRYSVVAPSCKIAISYYCIFVNCLYSPQILNVILYGFLYLHIHFIKMLYTFFLVSKSISMCCLWFLTNRRSENLGGENIYTRWLLFFGVFKSVQICTWIYVPLYQLGWFLNDYLDLIIESFLYVSHQVDIYIRLGQAILLLYL